MAKYKAAKPKSNKTPQMRPGVPCLIILIGGMLFVMFVLYEVMKNAS